MTDWWLLLVGQAAWQTVLVAAVVLVLVRVGCRWPAGVRRGLLAVALIKFLTPPFLAAPTGVLAVLAPPTAIVENVPVVSSGPPEWLWMNDKAFGQADVENNVAATPTTRFRTASLAKPLTATGVMVLAERGRLDLDAPIQKYCQAFPEKEHTVTARQLLGHLAGVRHYGRSGESLGTVHFFAIADSLAIFKADPLLHRPGDGFHPPRRPSRNRTRFTTRRSTTRA